RDWSSDVCSSDLLVESVDGLRSVTRRQLDLSQHLERSRVIWQRGIRLLCRELCLLEIALLSVEGDQREPGADRLRIHRHRLLEKHFDLARFAAEGLHEIGVAQQ